MAVTVALAAAVIGGGAVAVAVTVPGLTKRFLNHIEKDLLIGYWLLVKGYLGLKGSPYLKNFIF